MSRRQVVMGLGAALGLVASGCAGLDGLVDGGVDGPFWLWNRSQFDLLEVRVHDEEDYQGALNLLEGPLVPGGVSFIPLDAGQRVTVFRERVSGGELLALSTPQGISFPTEEGVLLVFDDGFRVMGHDEAEGLTGFDDALAAYDAR